MVSRKSPRLYGFDYSDGRIYFVTINCRHNCHLFGKIIEDGESNKLLLSDIGMIAKSKTEELSNHHPGVEVFEYVVMPNHIHLIVSLQNMEGNASLSTIIGSYKSGISREANKIFPGLGLWQKSFYDHIIRDDIDLDNHWEYIIANIARWKKDKYFMEE